MAEFNKEHLEKDATMEKCSEIAKAVALRYVADHAAGRL